MLMRRLHCPFDGLEAQACLVLASDQLPEPGSKPRPSIFSAWGHDRCLEACCLDQDSNQTCRSTTVNRKEAAAIDYGAVYGHVWSTKLAS